MRRWKLSTPRDLPWGLRGVETARHSLEVDDRGRMIMRISHAPLPGLSPEDVAWWFRNIGGQIDIDGKPLDRYLAWHPTDHIHWALKRASPAGGAGVGAIFHIVEAFGADMRFLVDVTETVARLDSDGITLEKRVAGVQVTQLKHDFGVIDGATTYDSTLTVGLTSTPFCRIVNGLIQRWVFPRAMGRAWIKHNIEEVGLLEHLIPLLRQQLATGGTEVHGGSAHGPLDRLRRRR